MAQALDGDARVVRHDEAPDRVREAVLEWLPRAEIAVALLDDGDVVLEVRAAGGTGRTLGVAVVLESVPTLSGAEVLAACASDPGSVQDVAPALAPALVPWTSNSLEISGPHALVATVAEEVARHLGGKRDLVMRQRLMFATSATPPTGVAGTPGLMTRDDHWVVAGWLDAFAEEALGQEPRGLDHWLERFEQSSMDRWLWRCDGAPVSLVVVRATTSVSSRIGPVYTPPPERGHGYAAALTAHVTAARLAGGDERVTLFTDAENATSNALYARVGYADVGESSAWSVHRQ